MTNPMIEARGLVKHYGDVVALDGLDLSVPEGTVLGLLGPNGAGKTTAVSILTTLLAPDAGSATVAGADVVNNPKAVRERIGLSGQYAAVDEHLTGFENLDMIGRLYSKGRADARARARELLEQFNLAEAGDRPVKTYSGGMRRRLDLAGALVASPPVLVLDEPTTGLDPRSRNQVWDIVRVLVGEGTTVLLTTQHLEEADELAGRIAIIDRGQVIAEGTSGELKKLVGTGSLRVRLHDPSQREEASRVLAAALDAPIVDGGDPTVLTARVADPDRVAHALSDLSHAGVALDEFSLGQPSLDEVFLTLTGHPAEPTEEVAA